MVALAVPPAVGLVALAAYVPSLAAIEARLIGTLRAIPGNVSHFVAIVARWFVGALGAVASNMSDAVAMIASKNKQETIRMQLVWKGMQPPRYLPG